MSQGCELLLKRNLNSSRIRVLEHELDVKADELGRLIKENAILKEKLEEQENNNV